MAEAEQQPDVAEHAPEVDLRAALGKVQDELDALLARPYFRVTDPGLMDYVKARINRMLHDEGFLASVAFRMDTKASPHSIKVDRRLKALVTVEVEVYQERT